MSQVFTVDSLRELIRDLRAQGVEPMAILLHPYEKRDVKQELQALGREICAADTSVPEDIERGALLNRDGNPLGDEDVIGIVQGVFVMSHPEVSRGKAQIIPKVNPCRTRYSKAQTAKR